MKGSFENEQHIKQTDAFINVNPEKSEIIIQQHKLTKTIKHFFGQTFLSQFMILNPSKNQLMNFNLYQDLMCYIANFINQQDMNLVISQQNNHQQNQQRLPNYELKHSVVIEHNQQQQQYILEQIGEILINIGEKIEQICINAYLHGDINLNSELIALINKYQPIIQNIE